MEWRVDRDAFVFPDLLVALGVATIAASLAFPWVTIDGTDSLRGWETAEGPAVVAVFGLLFGVGLLDRVRRGDWETIGITALGLSGAFAILVGVLYVQYPVRGFGGGPPPVAPGRGLYVIGTGGLLVFSAGLAAPVRVLLADGGEPEVD